MACGLLLAACGGGGGGTTSNGVPVGVAPSPPSSSIPVPVPPPVSTAAALRFSPETITATASAGTSVSAAVSAFVVRPGELDAPVFAMVIDESGVILPTARILAVTPTEYSAVLQTAPSLAPGSYNGVLTVKLCRDAGCASQFPGSPMSLPYAFKVLPLRPEALAAVPVTTLDTSMHLGAAPPRTLSVAVSASALQWTASSNVPWTKLSNATGNGNGVVSVDFAPAGLAEGKHEGVVSIASTDGQSVKLPVSLTVIASRFRTDRNGFIFFNQVNGAPISPQAVNFSLDSDLVAPWSLSSDSAWAIVSPASGVTPASATVTIDPSRGNLASGAHRANLTLSSPVSKEYPLPVQLDMTPPILATSVSTLTLGGSLGRDFGTRSVTVSLGTGTNTWPWALSGLPVWASASATSGTVGEAGKTLAFTPDPARAVVGTTTTMLSLQSKVNGDTLTKGIPLTINRDQRKILPSIVGVAMVSVPGWSRLSRTVTVSDNYGLGAGWSAASDKAWLAVQRDGASLKLVADPSALAVDAISYANVTLTPVDPAIQAPETIRVALWKGSSAPAATSAITGLYARVIADPIRPLVYLHNGGPTIDVFNVYTGQKTATINAGHGLGEMAVSPDGGRLYAYNPGAPGLLAVDLATLTPASLPIPADNHPGLKLIRPNGVQILVTGGGNYRMPDAVRLASLPANGWEERSFIVGSQDGKRLFLQPELASGNMDAYALDYSQTGGGSLSAARSAARLGGDVSSYGRDFATNADGSRVYTTAGQNRCTVHDANLNLLGELPSEIANPVSVEVDSFDRVYCGGGATYGSTADIWVFNPDGTLRTSFEFLPPWYRLISGQLAVSADGMMLVALAEAPTSIIIAVGP
jgi:hypothetical protein